jgi:hypothetical protein
MEIEPGLVLRDNCPESKTGYAILAHKKGEEYHFVTFYNPYSKNSFDEVLGWDVSYEELKDKISKGKVNVLDDKQFKKIKKAFDKGDFPFVGGLERIGLKENAVLYNQCSLLEEVS